MSNSFQISFIELTILQTLLSQFIPKFGPCTFFWWDLLLCPQCSQIPLHSQKRKNTVPDFWFSDMILQQETEEKAEWIEAQTQVDYPLSLHSQDQGSKTPTLPFPCHVKVFCHKCRLKLSQWFQEGFWFSTTDL